MDRARVVVLSTSLLAACASPPRPRPASPDLGAWVGAASDAPRAPSRAALVAPAAQVPRTLAAPPPVPSRPRPRAPVDVSFQQADMVSAFQFLADAGRFNLVMEDGLGGKVSARLRGVDPYDALLTIAGAHGAVVRYENEIVVVRRR